MLTVSERPIYNRGMPRKVILGFGISLDGYIARRNGDLDFLVAAADVAPVVDWFTAMPHVHEVTAKGDVAQLRRLMRFLQPYRGRVLIALGALLPLLPFIGYFALKGALAGFLYEIYLYPKLYAAGA